MKVLILGVTGMLGSAVFREFVTDPRFNVTGTLRNANSCKYFPQAAQEQLVCGIDVLDQDALVAAMEWIRPDIVINCVGLIKQLADAKDPLAALPINAMLPHRLARLCSLAGARLIHVSTDCVFSGRKGMYRESDVSDAEDLYGKSKFIGELHDLPNAITLRTSIIGHELGSCYALVDWFLSQCGPVKGYTKAFFSGLPTRELARVIRDYVIPHPELFGVFHVSAAPIDKSSLLKMVASVYGKSVEIIPDENIKIDRSLDSTRFRTAVGYQPPEWSELIRGMHDARN